MNLVLYSAHDLEAITVIDVPLWAIQKLKAKDDSVVRFPVQEKVQAAPHSGLPPMIHARSVEIFAQTLHWGHRETLMLLTYQDVTALELRSSLLPGQRKDDTERQRLAFISGFIRALEQM